MIRWNLQQFAGEKTEKATPKKRQEARKKGQVVKSQEINTAVTLFMALLACKLFAGMIVQSFLSFLRTDLTEYVSLTMTPENLHALFKEGILLFAKMGLPVAGIVLLSGLAISYLQVGSILTLEPLKPDLQKLNPIVGIKRMWSMRSLVDLLKAILKIGLIGYVAYDALVSNVRSFDHLVDMDVFSILSFIGDNALSLMWKMVLMFMGLAVLDYAYRWYEYEKELRMSKQEVKEEFKSIEGNPMIKRKIKERQRAIAMRRMMQDLKKADVVITNPTHYAVALQYDAKSMNAPVVLAKGMNELALRIKKMAREHDIVLVENRPLAQTLYKTTDIGETIPPELFQAVAEVLAYVYRLKRKV
jgi:flagellar biosynthetic protein FlhB